MKLQEHSQTELREEQHECSSGTGNCVQVDRRLLANSYSSSEVVGEVTSATLPVCEPLLLTEDQRRIEDGLIKIAQLMNMGEIWLVPIFVRLEAEQISMNLEAEAMQRAQLLVAGIPRNLKKGTLERT